MSQCPSDNQPMIGRDQYQHGGTQSEGERLISWNVETSAPHHMSSVTNPNLHQEECGPSSLPGPLLQDHATNPPATVGDHRFAHTVYQIPSAPPHPLVSQPNNSVSNASNNPALFTRPTQVATPGPAGSRAPIFPDEVQFWSEMASFVFGKDDPAAAGLFGSLMRMGMLVEEGAVLPEVAQFCSKTGKHLRFFAANWWAMIATAQELMKYSFSTGRWNSIESVPVDTESDDFTLYAAAAAHAKMGKSADFQFQKRHYDFYFSITGSLCWFSILWPRLRSYFPKEQYPRKSLFYLGTKSQASLPQSSAATPQTPATRSEVGPCRTARPRYAAPKSTTSQGSGASSRATGRSRNPARMARPIDRTPLASDSGLGATQSNTAISPSDLPPHPPSQFTESSTLPLGGEILDGEILDGEILDDEILDDEIPDGQVQNGQVVRHQQGAQLQRAVVKVSNGYDRLSGGIETVLGQVTKSNVLGSAAASTSLCMEVSKQFLDMSVKDGNDQRQIAERILTEKTMPASVIANAEQQLNASINRDMNRDSMASIERAVKLSWKLTRSSIALGPLESTSGPTAAPTITAPATPDVSMTDGSMGEE